MDEDLARKLLDTYGYLPKKVHEIYSKVDPLNSESYWKNVNIFLENLHNILYKPVYSYSLKNITPEHYFFITQICVINSFDIFQRIQILNNQTRKPCKTIANLISHEHLHDYLTYLRQNNSKKPSIKSRDTTQVHVHPLHEVPNVEAPEVEVPPLQYMYHNTPPLYSYTHTPPIYSYPYQCYPNFPQVFQPPQYQHFYQPHQPHQPHQPPQPPHQSQPQQSQQSAESYTSQKEQYQKAIRLCSPRPHPPRRPRVPPPTKKSISVGTYSPKWGLLLNRLTGSEHIKPELGPPSKQKKDHLPTKFYNSDMVSDKSNLPNFRPKVNYPRPPK